MSASLIVPSKLITGLTSNSELPTKEFFTTGHVSSQDVANLPADRRDCLICMAEFEKITWQDLDANPDLANDCVKTCGPFGSDCRKHHMFHCKCISTWLGTSNTCPACRTVVYRKEQLEGGDAFHWPNAILDNNDEEDIAEEPDDHGNDVRLISTVVPESAEREQEPWFEVHNDYLQMMTDRRVEYFRTIGDLTEDQNLYRDSTTMVSFGNCPALGEFNGTGLVNATMLTNHLGRFYWMTFALNIPRNDASTLYGAICKPAVMSAWQRLTEAIRARDGEGVTVSVFRRALLYALKREGPIELTVRPVVQAMIDEVVLTFGVSAKAAARRREQCRLPARWARRHHKKMLRRRRGSAARCMFWDEDK